MSHKQNNICNEQQNESAYDDLLAVCKATVKHFEIFNGVYTTKVDNLLKMAKRAIEKAEGQS